MPLPLVIILVFAGTASVVAFVAYLLIPKKTELQERLEQLMPQRQQDDYLFDRPPSSWQEFLAGFGKKVPLGGSEQGKYRRMLIAAGIRRDRLAVFVGSKLMLAAVLPVVYLLVYGIPVEKDMTTNALLAVVFGITGFLLPSLWLADKVKKRQAQIFRDLPDVLDLMTVCVDAGQSIDSSMITITKDFAFASSPLIAEMKIALRETRAGKPRLDALRDMGERSMLDDLKSFTAMLIQTEKMGTSLAQAMRVHADSFRTMRMQRAQEAAAKTTIKLLFPLVFFILPALFVVMLLPALIRIMKVISGI